MTSLRRCNEEVLVSGDQDGGPTSSLWPAQGLAAGRLSLFDDFSVHSCQIDAYPDNNKVEGYVKWCVTSRALWIDAFQD
jgi:hypothetical protein